MEIFLEPFLRLCFPKVHGLIDWRFSPVFLETELQQIAPRGPEGVRAVDKLVKVRLRSGAEEWLFIHIEIQAQAERDFPARMWAYFCGIFHKFQQRVISLAVLADERPNWRPCSYQAELGGCAVHFEYPTFKVIDLEDAAGVFERTSNPFALLIAAHQAALATRSDASGRYAERFRLVRYLYRGGMERRALVDLFRLIEALTRLPEEMELRFRRELATFERTEAMMTTESIPSFIEVKAKEEGRQEGRQEGRAQGLEQAVLDALEARFGAVPEEVRSKLHGIAEPERLRQAHRLAITTRSLQQFLLEA